ncbi:MAG: VIT and VWA domain-containing protein [Acidobacteriia bacterium]|nr:VIT and VWA domain-containing protein [Terriglobia bacterium]
MIRAFRVLLFIVSMLAAATAFGDAGVIIPMGAEQPNPAALSLDEMRIDIVIDNGDARIFMTQIYANHEPGILEGTYLFALPSHATVSDFAVWDGVTRIPGVILERKRAEEIYNSLKWQAIDPGLLQMGERTAQEARRTAVFSARIVPIPAYGTKRVEIEYHEALPVESLKSFFAVPLHPDAYHVQTAEHLTINFELRSQHAIRDFEVVGKTYPLNITERSANLIKGTFEGNRISFIEDFAIKYGFDEAKSDSLEVLTYRNPKPAQPSPTEMAPEKTTREPGFFEASALFSSHGPSPGAGASGAGTAAPRTLIILFDTSLSMQWEKLDRSFRALEALLRSLRPSDRFNLLLFNTEMNWYAKQPVAADRATVEKALAFVRGNPLRGGTDLQRALDGAFNQVAFVEGDKYLVLLSDGDATRGPISNARLASSYAQKWNDLPAASRPETYVFGVGDDVNLPLLRMLTKDRGVLESVRSTEPIDFKLNAFLDKIGRYPIAQLRLTTTPAENFDLVYPLEDAVFPGAIGNWVGQYKRPAPSAQFAIQGQREGRSVALRATVPLPAEALEHASLPRTWAKARVDALLAKIEREGEDQASVDEIIRLARKYKFVTPYTSFLAAPRALLRPRVIRPGDPVIRVKTDPSIVSVIALFPFGLVKKLRYLQDEDIWQTRFLAPTDMTDGTYLVRLILRDQAGHVYRESKSFVIVTQPPVVRVRLNRKQYRRGEVVELRASASARTRTIVARMYGVPPVYLKWDQQAESNVGEMVVPGDLPAGRYQLTVTAEDIAHNIGSKEVSVDVVP